MIIGILLSVVFIYLSVRGLNFKEVAASFRAVRYGYIIPVLFVLLFIQFLRSYRWGLILSPIEKINQLSLFSVTCVGFLAIIAIPARLGELARPYLITHKSNVKMTAALGSIFLERAFDVLTILIMFFTVALLTPLPPWLMKSSVTFFVIILCVIALTIFLVVRRDTSLKILKPVIGRLSEKYSHKLEELVNHFVSGFKMIADFRLIMYVTFLSMLIWAVNALAIYILFFAFDFHLPAVAAIAVMIVVIIGITIPTAPGFIGNWHFFCILGLGLFGISRVDAMAYAVLYHFLAIGIAVALGLVFLPSNTFFLSDLRGNLISRPN